MSLNYFLHDFTLKICLFARFAFMELFSFKM
jgi:hypothetical protein